MLEGAWEQIAGTFIDGLDRRIDAEFDVRTPVRDPVAHQAVTNDPARPPVVAGRPNAPTVAGISSLWLIGGGLVLAAVVYRLLK